MRTALILDRERIGQEHPMFNRLCIGLLAEGVHPTRVLPTSFDPAREDPRERRIALLPRVSYRPDVLPWLRRARISRLAEELDRFAPQLLHAAGATIWSMAIGVADELERPLVIGVWSLREAAAARRYRNAGAVAAWLAPGERIASALREHVDPALVHLVGAGVPVPECPPAPRCRAAGQSPFLVVLGEGVNLDAWEAFLIAAREVADLPSLHDLQLVLEIRGPRGHDIWRKVRDLGLLDRACSIADAAQHGQLLLRGDALCLPEPTTSLRTILLESMAQGMPVASVDAPAVDALSDRAASAFVAQPTSELWSATLRRLLDRRDDADAMVQAAWSRIRLDHRSSMQIEGIADLYRLIVAGDALPFRPADADAGPA